MVRMTDDDLCVVCVCVCVCACVCACGITKCKREVARRKRRAANVAMIQHRVATNELVDPNHVRLRKLQLIDPKCEVIMKGIRDTTKGSTYNDPILRSHKELRGGVKATMVKGMLMVSMPVRRG